MFSVIIGTGNVGHFFLHLLPSSVVVQPRALEGMPVMADLYIIAVKDDAIASIARRLRNVNGVVTHTSGTVGMDVLSRCRRRGVLYPLQTLTRGVGLKVKDVPMLVEGSDQETTRMLLDLARGWVDNAFPASSEVRRKAHLAAVMANNFTNHLWTLASEILERESLPKELLFPLMDETLRKAKAIGPQAAQTGPARRGDTGTMESHMEMLPELQAEIYRKLSESITSHYADASQPG